MDIDLIKQELEEWVHKGCPANERISSSDGYLSKVTLTGSSNSFQTKENNTRLSASSQPVNTGFLHSLGWLVRQLNCRPRFIIGVLCPYLIAGWMAWDMSPIKPTSVIWGFALLYLVLVLALRHVKLILVLTSIAVGLLIVDVFGVATWHDVTINKYASAMCGDGWYSYSEHRRGTCSWHGGVSTWRPQIPPWWKRFR